MSPRFESGVYRKCRLVDIVTPMENSNEGNELAPAPSGRSWLREIGVVTDQNEQLTELLLGVKSEKIRELRQKGYEYHKSGQYREAVEIFESANDAEEELTQSKHIIERLNTGGRGVRRPPGQKKKLVVVSNRPLFAPVIVSRPKILGTSEDTIALTKRNAKKRKGVSSQSSNFFVRESKADHKVGRALDGQPRSREKRSVQKKRNEPEMNDLPNLFVVNATSLSTGASSTLGKLKPRKHIQPKYSRMPPSAVNNRRTEGTMKSPLLKRQKARSRQKAKPKPASRKITGMREMRIPIVQTILDDSSVALDNDDSIILPTH